MEPPFSVDVLTERMKKLQASEEYQKNCQKFRLECERLEIIAQTLQTQKDILQDTCSIQTVRHEFASGSDLHRGFYCPSPTCDLIVGNTHRGKLLKRLTFRSNPSHEYGFSADGKLLWCNWLYNGTVAMTEYLIRKEDTIYGITFDSTGRLSVITEEVYRDGRLVSYLYGLNFRVSEEAKLNKLRCEYFHYDAEGLCRCELDIFMLPPPMDSGIPDILKEMTALIQQPLHQHDDFMFTRENGLLTGTYCKEQYYPFRQYRKA